MALINKLSRIGIGMYRMAIGVSENEQAIYKALTKNSDSSLNINVIDTSTNYGDGDSEALVGKVLQNPRPETLKREEIFLTSKFGYIQNTNMQLYLHREFEDVPDEHIVKYAENCYHCIHPKFMKYQLNLSLKRIGTDYIDLYLIHNPEYFLNHKIRRPEDDIKGAQAEMLDRIGQTFEALEDAISKGLIRCYGISSNSFSLPKEDKHFLPYFDLIKRAENASLKIRGTSDHGFAAIQLPGNLLEQDGLKTTAAWAKENHLKVFINRPLNAFTAEGEFRLASYPESGYQSVKESTLSNLKSESNTNEASLPQVLNMVKQLDDELPKIRNVFHWQQYRYMVFGRLRQLGLSQSIYSIIYKYLDAFDAEVRYRDSQRVRKYLIERQGYKVLDEDKGKPIEELALEFLLGTGVVDTVLLGMTKVRYVDFAHNFLTRLQG